MQVNVKLFSFFCQAVGTDRLTVQLKDGASISDLLHQLSSQFKNPVLEDEQVVVLINQKQASLQSILNEGDSILLLPVLSGG